jgi:hypothetical protein
MFGEKDRIDYLLQYFTPYTLRDIEGIVVSKDLNLIKKVREELNFRVRKVLESAERLKESGVIGEIDYRVESIDDKYKILFFKRLVLKPNLEVK